MTLPVPSPAMRPLPAPAQPGGWLAQPFDLGLDPLAGESRSHAADALKWVALGSMLLDHVHAAFWQYAYPWATAAGRIAWPLFALVFAWNLARAGSVQAALARGVARRLVLGGLAATPAYLLIRGGAAPHLNIMFTLLAATWCLTLATSGRRAGRLAAGALFLASAGLVDHLGFGVAFVMAAWSYWQSRTRGAALVLLAALAAQTAFIASIVGWAALGALGAVALALAAPHWRWPIPAPRLFFHVFYPLHLTVIAAIALALAVLAQSS